jgi:hypothetical protein
MEINLPYLKLMPVTSKEPLPTDCVTHEPNDSVQLKTPIFRYAVNELFKITVLNCLNSMESC